MAVPARCISCVEVPIVGGDKMRWSEVSVPSSVTVPVRSPDQLPSHSSIYRNASFCHVVSGDPTAYLVWRIHKETPKMLEVLELFPSKEYPGTGLRLVFKDELYPFAYLCRNEIQRPGRYSYLLYVLTVSGVAFLLSLRSPTSYTSGSVFPHDDILEVVVQTELEVGKITAVAATSGCLVIGRADGLICCYKLGMLDSNEPGFVHELRDDGAIGRLWSLMSRGKVVAPVQDVMISEVRGRQLLFVLHKDGTFRIWDLGHLTRIFNHNINSHVPSGLSSLRFWVGEDNKETGQLPLAMFCGNAMEPEVGMITVCTLVFNNLEKVIILPEPLIPGIPLKKGRIIDLRILSDKIWVLKEDESIVYDLFQINNERQLGTYLQEAFVADQLFQNSEHGLDDITLSNEAMFFSMKDQAAYFISSMFFHRLVQPGVYHSSSLRSTMLDHKKYFSDQEFQLLTLSGLKREILTIIESEGVATNPTSMSLYWKSLCANFSRHLCQNNTPFGFLFDSSSNAIGLIRKSTVSLFRDLDGIEQLIYGSSEDLKEFKNVGLGLLENDIDREVLFGLLRCMSNIHHQLGRAASAIFYESLISPVIPIEEIIFHLLKVLEIGYTPFTEAAVVSQFGVDVVWEKQRLFRKSQRMYSVEMLLSLLDLYEKASSWDMVFNVIEKFVEYLHPKRSKRISHLNDSRSINFNIMIQATAQVARVKFESAFDVLMLLRYMIKISGQIRMTQSDVAKIKIKLVPSIQTILIQWLILHFMCSTPTFPLAIEDFSSQLSSLHIDNKGDHSSWIKEKLGSFDFTLGCLLDFPSLFDARGFVHSKSFPGPRGFTYSTQNFSGLILGQSEESPFYSNPTLQLASLLLQNGQYEAAESILTIGTYLSKQKFSATSAYTSGEECVRHHFLGYCLLLQAHRAFHGVTKKQKVLEAVRCLFRAALEQGASQYLRNCSSETGFSYHGELALESVWKLHYYQWAMQVFEQHNMSGAACQFALAALEQVDEVVNDGNNAGAVLPEHPTTIRGQLWANVFKFTLDLKQYQDSYCAIISNSDEDNKHICLRRFVNVLCELGETKVLCDGTIPFVGLIEKVEQELSRKADISDISTSTNLYKILYAFEAKRNNWRKAASNVYRYFRRLKKDGRLGENGLYSSVLQESLNALSAAINALHLVDPVHAWIDLEPEDLFYSHDPPNKKARKDLENKPTGIVDVDSQKHQSYVDIEILENEYIITSAQLLIARVNDKVQFSGTHALAALVDALIQESFYDMAFTVILKFWKGSNLNRELEQAFVAISQKCCLVGNSAFGSNLETRDLLLLLPEKEISQNIKPNSSGSGVHTAGSNHWGLLELYLEKYRKLHPRLPVTVAETLLRADPNIELPLWLVHMFKGGWRTAMWGMSGQEADAAALFRLYLDYGRLSKATNLLVEHIEPLMLLRPSDVIHRKKMSAIWFPYVAIERLWCQLEELRSSGKVVEQSEKLKDIMGVLRKYLIQVNSDSNDVVASELREEQKHPDS